MKKLFITAGFLCALCGCVSSSSGPGGYTGVMSQLQIREFQTRSFETADTLLVIKALLNVLQDDFYIVKNADAALGLVTATKEVDVDDRGFWSKHFSDKDQRWKKNAIVECSGTVSAYGNRTKVRMNFQIKIFDNRGEVMAVEQVQDQKFYQNFFFKVDKGIFLAKEKL
jgi:hypothetical protein